jgi:hypothetical protein
MAALLEVLVPSDGDSAASNAAHVPGIRPTLQWLAIALLGIGIGVVLLVGEWSGEGLPAPQLRVMLASVFIGAALVGLSMAYYFLRRPLSLFRY